MDFILRLGAIASALGAAATMATSDETFPFFTQFFQFEASYAPMIVSLLSSMFSQIN